MRRASQIIAVSESTKRDLVKMLGVREDKISVIYEAADPLFRPDDRLAALRHVQTVYGLSDEFILFVGTIEPRKNIGGLLRAYRRMRDDYKLPHGLVLAGAPGWLSDDVYELVDKLDLRPHCHFLGRVSAPDLRYLYNAASCLVHPAFYEGFGLTPLEAMACGTPVVVSNVSSLPEVVGDAALLVDPLCDDEITVALWRVLSDSALAAELRTKGLQRAAVFSWQRAAQQTMAVYRQGGRGLSSIARPTDYPMARILILTPQLPIPPQALTGLSQGTTIRNFNLIAGLAKRHTLDLVSFPRRRPSRRTRPRSAALRPYCDEIITEATPAADLGSAWPRHAVAWPARYGAPARLPADAAPRGRAP